MSFKFCSRNFRTTHFAFAALQTRCFSRFAGILLAGLVLSLSSAWPQGLKLVPTITTIAGNGTTGSTGIISTIAGTQTGGFSGDGGAAGSAQFQYPAGLAFDSAGNLYINDVLNYRVRKITATSGVISSSSIISTVAGNGAQGYSGDGVLATSAEIGAAYGVAVDSAGNLYIADSGNNRIREVSASTGKISTIAGNGTAGFSGDGGAATSAELYNIYGGLALDSAGNVYIADTNNFRIRMLTVSNGIIDTIAGNGTQGYAGDNGPATSAEIGGGQRVEYSNGNIYIAQGLGSVIRMLSMTTTTIPSTQVGTSVTENVLFEVTGAATTITSFSVPISQGGVAEYTVGTVTGCAVDGTTANPVGTVCTVPITFTPGYEGLRQEPLIAVTSGGTEHFGLNGTGVAPQAVIYPGIINTIAGTATASYTGDSGAATSATLNDPNRVTVDDQGNVFISDTGNNVVREVAAATGKITTVAGNGSGCSSTTGPCGDGGAATSANLGAPTSTAVDAAGNLYISDTYNHRIRMVSANTGYISTVAGNGNAGYSGDGGAATSAELNTPEQVLVDPSGNLYIVDTRSNVVRYVSAATGFISTIAGNGAQCSSTTAACGDGGAATSAQLYNPEGIARDLAGNLYIADFSDNRIRKVSAATGVITTVAGTGTAGYTADGGAATSAELNGPHGIDVDPAGNLYISDQYNSAVRMVLYSTGTIMTIAGNGTQCSSATSTCGDGAISTAGPYLMGPVDTALDSTGALYIADYLENKVRKLSAPSFQFATTAAGATSTDSPKDADVVNIGNESLTINAPTSGTNAAFPTGFENDNSSSCPSLTSSSSASSLAQGAECSLNTDFTPTGAGAFSGSVVLTDNSLNASAATQSIAVSGTGTADTTSTTVTSSLNPSLSGQSVTFTATIADTTGNLTPAGTVQFSVDGTPTGSPVTVSSDKATLAISTLAVGSHTITAVFTPSSTGLSSSTSAGLTQVVNKDTPSQTLTTSNANPTFGQSVTLTDTLPAVNGITPTGTVTFYNGSTSLGTGTISGGVATLSTSTLPVGTDSITAVYGGDAKFSSATSNAVTETVGKSSAADTLTTSNASPAYGQSVTLTDTIPVEGGVAPTGTVTFYNGSTAIGTGTVNASGVATLATGSLPVGTDSITAIYGGDSNYSQVTSNAVTETVSKATPTLTAPTVSPSNSTYGTSVTITQTVPATETGTVSFYSGTTLLGTATISNGTATLTTTALPAGTDSITGQASGDSNYNAATSPATSDTVSKATPTLAGPTVSPANAAFGTSVTITQTVPAGETGTVSFYSGTTLLGTATISNGVATLTTSALPAGTDSITGQASGDSNYNPSTSAATTDNVSKITPTLAAPSVSPANAAYGTSVVITQTVPAGETGTVTFLNGTTVLGTGTISNGVATLTTTALPAGADSITGQTSGDSNYNAATSPATTDNVGKASPTLAAPTVSPANAAYGTSVTITQTVPSGETGTVSFYSGTTLLGTGTISNGVATLTTSALPAGTDSITGQTSGDSNYNAGTSPATTDNVGKATPTLAGPTVSPANAAYGTSVTITQTVPSGETGTVSFYNGTTLLGTATISNGVATLTTSALPAGTDSITGQTSGDSNYNAATSPATTDTVGKATPTLTAPTVSPMNSPYGTSVTITQTVPTGETGTVSFYSGTTLLGTGTISNGTATLTTTALPVGTDSITGAASGDSNYGMATSPATTDTVGKATPTLTAPTVSPMNSPYGTSVTITQTVPTGETGTVSFYSGATLLGTGTISNGVATLTTSALPAGTDSITGQTSGDSNYNAATSPATTDNVGKVSGADTLTTSNASPTYGQQVTLTDTIPTVNGTAPTGTVTFYNGTTVLGTGTVNASGVATLSTGALPVGTDSVTAVYGGDSNYASVTSNAIMETVGKANGADSLTTSDASPADGQTVTFTDTIPIVNGVAPTGTVTFYDGGTAIGTGTVNASGVATLSTGTLPVGSDSITATYAGDSNYASSTAGPITENVSKSSSADTLTTSNASISLGQSVTFTDTIPVVGGTAPTGTVTFYSGTTAIGTGTVNASGVATLTTSALTAGSDSITAVYPGDSNYNSANAGPLTETVSKASGADTLTSSNTAPSVGQSVTFTDTIPVVGGISPTGTVTFYDGTTVIGTGTVNASGVATLSTGSLPAGTDSITAAYGGDSNYAAVTSNAVTENVGKSTGADTLTTSNASPALGQSVTFTDTIPVVGGIAPTGTVTFYDGNTVIGTGTVNASGVATLTTGSLPAGTDSITAVYGGDSNYASVTSNAVTETVGKASETDTLTTSNSTPVVGQSVTFTDTIPVVGGIAPTGTVTFYDGTTAIGTGTVNASGVATLTTGSLPAGTDSITAVYGGDSNYNTSTAGPVTETVGKATSTDTLTTSNASITLGQSVTFTDTIPVVGGIAPTGTVTFYDGNTAIGTGTLNASGVATLTTGALPAGSDSITAVYPGDSNYSASNAGPLTETVSKASGADTLTTSNSTPAVGQSVTFTDTIPVVGGIAPTGTVTFYDGNTVIGTGTVNASGVATLTTGSLPAGTDSITAVYGGDSNYASVTSNAVTETVATSTDTGVLSSSNLTPAFGSAVTFTDTISKTGSATIGGTVTFYDGTTVIGTGTVNASGVATLTTSSLPEGTDTITAVYAGDSNYAASTTNPVVETVSKAMSTSTLTTSNPSITVGQSVTFTDTLKIVGGVVPTGTVTFYDGTTVIGTGTVNASGVATITTGSLPAGNDPITAVYSGDGHYDASTTATLAETVVSAAVQASGTNVLTASTTSAYVGQSVTLTDTVSSSSGPEPTGTVSFYSNGQLIGTGTLNASGVATLTTTALLAGSDSITAVYSGDMNYQASTSNTVVVKVAPIDFTIAATPANQTINPGDTVSYQVALSGFDHPFNRTVVLSATGLPPGATVSFSPAELVPGAGPTNTTMTIVTSPTQAMLEHSHGLPTISYGLFLLPLLGIRKFRRRLLTLPRGIVYSLAILIGLGAIGTITGCGGGYFGNPPQQYTITVTGTSGSLQHSTTVTLTVR